MQGDPMSMLLFTVAISKAIKTTAQFHPTVRPLAFADDINLIGKPADLKKAHATLTTELAKVGCRCSPVKSKLLLKPQCKTECETLASELQAELQTSVKVLGVPIAPTKLAANAFDNWKEKFLKDCQAVKDFAATNTQGALKLLIMCIQTQPGFIMQTTPTEETKALADFVDDNIMSTLAYCLDEDLSSLAAEAQEEFTRRARMMIKDGGMGMRPWKHVRLLAYLSNIVKARDSRETFTNKIYDDIAKFARQPNGPAHQAVEELKTVPEFETMNQD